MRNIIAILVVVLVSIFVINTPASADTFHGVWSKNLYTQNGLMTLSREVIKYDVEVPEGASVVDLIESMPRILGMTALHGRFSNLQEFEVLINRELHATPYSGFHITDVYVDER